MTHLPSESQSVRSGRSPQAQPSRQPSVDRSSVVWARLRSLAWFNLATCASILALGGLKWQQFEAKSLPVLTPTTTITQRATPVMPTIRINRAALPQLGDRHKFNYQQWVELLEQEAIAVASQAPENLDILVGDSITLWFPPDLLPDDRTWLNQGISGDTSDKVFQRLPLLDRTTPDRVFVMIGINDLLQGASADSVVSNTRAIVQDLRRQHPQAQIILQSVLPHAGADATWEGRAKLLNLPNAQIEQINTELAAIATEFEATYLDLYPLFLTEAGTLNPELTTDGLHLNRQGYWVWRTAIQTELPVPTAASTTEEAAERF